MTLYVHTARIDYAGPDRLDVTRKSGVLAFAPSWRLLRPYLARRTAGVLTEADWTEYAAKYTDEMRESYRANRATWDELLARERVTLVCYCVDVNRCHRRVLARILVKLGAAYDGEW
jgi:uncharacterized protein YeaO (DUF488 family)